MSVSTDLRAAADYLRKYGLKLGEVGEDGGPRCMLGVAYSVAGVDYYSPRSGAARLDAMLNALRKVTVCDVSEFSDAHCRSTDDAVAAFEIAADVATRWER